MILVDHETIMTRMQDSAMKALKTVMQRLRPTIALTVSPARSVCPHPVCIAREIYPTRIIVFPNTDAGKGIAAATKIDKLNMKSHTTPVDSM
jgi:hypothetical protein